MSFGGDLKGLSLGDVFQNVAANRSTGTLHVAWPRGERFVHFAEGAVTAFADGTARGLLLLQHLLERGRVTPEQFDGLRAKMQKSKRTPAKFLVAEGVLTADGLPALFQQVTCEGVYELLLLKDAKFRFQEGPPAAELFDADLLAHGLKLEAGPLLLEGARRADDTLRMRTVIGSDDELFVTDGTTEAPADELQAAVLQHLDGTTDLPGLCAATGQSRFAVAGALAGLVQQGIARRARPEEIEHLADTLQQQGDAGGSIRLLRRALERKPRDEGLRRRLAEALVTAGHPGQAAAELAALGFQAVEDERPKDALTCYQRAIELHPADIVLHERRCSLLEHLGDGDGLLQGLLAWSDRLLALGLLDRARAVLQKAVDGALLRQNQDLLTKLAEVLTGLGDHDGAAARWLQLAKLQADDPEAELRCLRTALELRPDDQVLRRRVRDLESGRLARLRARRRTITWCAAAATLLFAATTAGIFELQSSHALTEVLRETVSAPEDPRSLEALLAVAEQHAWMPSGLRAGKTARDRAIQLLAHAHELLRTGDCDLAAASVQAATAALPAERSIEAGALAERIAVERPLHDWLRRVEARGADDGEACEGLARATGSDQLAFVVDQLPRAHCDAARRSLLRALQGRSDPRAAKAVAIAYLETGDVGVAKMCEGLLTGAGPRLLPREQQTLRQQLQAAGEHPERRERALRAAALLFADAAAPR